jgi:hypothetical protein
MFDTISSDVKIEFEKIITLINKKFKTKYSDLNNFIELFEKYDWKKITNMHKQYLYFHKKIIKLYNQNSDLEKFKRYKCFKKINKFIDDTNKIEIIN